MFDLCSIHSLNKNFCVEKDALDTDALRTPSEMFSSLMPHLK